MNVSAHLSDETEHSPEDSCSPWRLAFSAPASCQVERFSQLMLRLFKLHVITVYSESPCHCAAFPWHSGRLPGCSFTFRPSALSPSVLVLRSPSVCQFLGDLIRSHGFCIHLTVAGSQVFKPYPLSPGPDLHSQLSALYLTLEAGCQHVRSQIHHLPPSYLTQAPSSLPRISVSCLTHAGHCRDLTIFTQAMLPGCSSPSILLPLPISPCCLFPGGLPSVCPVPVTGIDFLDKT